MATLGWKAGPEQHRPQDLVDWAVLAEQSGFESIDISDHFQPWDPRGQAGFAWTILGAMAARTSTIRLGPGVTCPFVRYHPAVVAQMAATLGTLAPGRTILGIGTGEALNEYAATGRWPGYDERRSMMTEAVELIRQLWTGEEVTFDGDHFHTRKAKIYSLPDELPPICVSTVVEASAETAGVLGDGLWTVGGKPDATYQGILAGFEKGQQQVGRSGGEKLVEINVALTDDVDAAVEAAQTYWGGTFVPALFDQNIYSPAMSAEQGSVVTKELVLRTSCISPDPEEHAAFAQHYLDLGFDHLFFHHFGTDEASFLEDYGTRVLPLLR